jgi:iron-sulfur cluster assembly protein
MDIITFSPTAIAQIQKNLQNDEHSDLALRIAATMTPDETVNYGMGFDESKEDDVQFTVEGVNFLVGAESVELLNGAHVDFVEIEDGQHHFIFLNPNDPSYKPPTEEGAVE